MHKLTRILIWCFLFFVFIATIMFTFANTQSVELSFGFFSLAPQPIALWVIAAFTIGGITGVLLSLGLMKGLRARMEIRRLHAQIAKLERDLVAAQAVNDAKVDQLLG